MAKRAVAPKGFYTAKDVMRVLGIANSTLYHYVDTGKLKKVVPPDRKEGYYLKSEVDKMARAKDLFLLQYSDAPKTYERASSEDDIRGIYDLCVAAFGINNTPPLEERLEEWRQLPETYYVVKLDNIVVGYISLLWITDEALADLMTQRKHQTSLTVDVMNHFVTGQPIDHLFISLAVLPGLTNEQQHRYGFILLRDTEQILEDFAKRGMIVKKLYAVSRTTSGIKLARDLGMKETRYPNDPVLRFELDMENATSPLALEYRKILEQVAEEQQS